MSTHGKQKRASSVAKRIRWLRGSRTQQEFSDAVGLSRSSIANYETGRSTPDEYVLAQIAKASDVADTFFADIDLVDDADKAAIVGAAVEGKPNWTDDEWAFVRLLRISSPSVVCEITGLILDRALNAPIAGSLVDMLNLREDLERVGRIHKQDGKFLKGETSVSGDYTKAYLGIDTKREEGPQ